MAEWIPQNDYAYAPMIDNLTRILLDPVSDNYKELLDKLLNHSLSDNPEEVLRKVFGDEKVDKVIKTYNEEYKGTIEEIAYKKNGGEKVDVPLDFKWILDWAEDISQNLDQEYTP